MPTIDINCDMGEGAGSDAELMPLISSANIACGFHAGNEDTMRQTLRLAFAAGVAAGAHVSFPDRQNFGRTEMELTPEQVYQLVQTQVNLLRRIAAEFSRQIIHVKPHGALYNLSARDARLAAAIARAVYDLDPSLVLFGLSGGESIKQADMLGLKTASEAFADRGYENDGSLRSRKLPGALLETEEEVAERVWQLVYRQTVKTVDGLVIPLTAQTICIHGDGEYAVSFARTIHKMLTSHAVQVKSF